MMRKTDITKRGRPPKQMDLVEAKPVKPVNERAEEVKASRRRRKDIGPMSTLKLSKYLIKFG